MMNTCKNLLLMLFAFLATTFAQGQQSMFTEGFENGVIPDTWTIHDMNADFRMWEADSRTSQTGDWCVGVSANSDGSKNDWLVTPKLLPTTENHTYSFWAKSQVPLPELAEDFKVKISTTGTNPEDFDVLIGEELAIPATWSQFSYDLSDYTGQEIYVALINEDQDRAVMFADDFVAPFFYFDNDLKLSGFDGETMLIDGQEATFQASVTNYGWQQQTDYTVKLFLQDGTELTSVAGPALDPFAQTQVTLTWTASGNGPTSIYAEIFSAADEDTGNNRSSDWYVSIQTGDLVEVSHGDFVEKDFSPIFFPAKTSLSESVYLADEIGMMGSLEEIAWSADFQYEIREKNIRIWIGETDLDELDMEWVPSNELTLVYDGKITVPKGMHMIPVRLDQPYTYTGGNLVVMIERSWDQRAYGFDNEFNITTTGTYRTIQYSNNFETTDPENPSVDPYWTSSDKYTPDAKFYFDVEGMGSLTGTATDDASQPMAGVLITAEELNNEALTANDGTYTIPYIYSGDYHFTAAKHGYYDTQGEITLAENQAGTLDFEMLPIPQVVVEGTVTGSDHPDEGIAGASITLEGYENYTATTDDQGAFSLGNVYSGNVYLLSIAADGYVPYQMEVEVGSTNVDLGTLVLNELTPPPIQVTATDFDMMAGISWIEPNGLPGHEFRYDDGNIVSQLGLEGNLPNAVMGAVHPTNSIITSVSWFLTDEVEHTTVKLFIFGLDLMGKPDETNILFQSGEIANIDNQWNTFELPQYIDAPDGFFLGVCTPGQFTAIGIDDGVEDPWVFNFGTHYVVNDWTAGNDWMDIADQGFFQNMMLRANGYAFGPSQKTGQNLQSSSANNHMPQLIKTKARVESPNPPQIHATDNIKALESYKVYRLLKGDEAFEDQWTTLSENYTGTWYDDPMWSGVEPGIYRYAVKAVYTNGLLSMPRFSNELVKEEKMEVTFDVTTNSGDPVTGATFSFAAEQGYPGYTYSTMLDESGQVMLMSVPQDTYQVDISLEGFDDFHAGGLVVASDTSFSFVLTENFPAPFNPLVEVNGDGSALFSWNNVPDAVTEDFESLENFSQNLGAWTSLDVDGANTTEFGEFSWPLNGEPLGFVTFNPQATEPAMEGITAYSGERCAAAINTADLSPSDDWLISPKIDNVIDGTVFSFMARSTSEMWELEWFRVGVSTTGTNPEDFTIISEGDFLTAPAWDWQEFSFDLSAYAGQEIYVAIQHVSVESYMLLIDDLFVGMPAKQTRALTGYTVYLDGEEMGTTTDENFQFSNLVNGQQYVAAVQANYATGSSVLVSAEFTGQNTTGIASNNEEQVRLYPNPSNGTFCIKTKNTALTDISVFDATGQLVYRKNSHGPQFNISIPAATRGIYWVKLVSGKDTLVKKLVVK